MVAEGQPSTPSGATTRSRGGLRRPPVTAQVIHYAMGFGIIQKAINRMAEIYHDLHISGDDASELLDGISKTYGTSFTGFIFDNYFQEKRKPFGSISNPASASRIARVSRFKDRRRVQCALHCTTSPARKRWCAKAHWPGGARGGAPPYFYRACAEASLRVAPTRAASAAAMNSSKSPSSTASGLPVSTPVRRSFTSRYGAST